MATNKIVVIGAGVSGLTTAYLLSKEAANHITVVAKHMPGDYDIEYASPWAGANYLPVGKLGSPQEKWERATWPYLAELAKNHPDAGIHFQESFLYNREKDRDSTNSQFLAELMQKNPWFMHVLPDFQHLPDEKLPPGFDDASRAISVCINTAIYLPWLAGQCLKNGVVIKRDAFKHVIDATRAHHSGKDADLVVNCTGLSSKNLDGVRDGKLYPARGQVVIVRNDPGAMVAHSGTDDGDDQVVYMMARAAGGGAVLGGTYQLNQWDSLPDPNQAISIMKRAIAARPELVAEGQGIEGLDIIRHGVGLRPVREGGPRVEMEKIDGISVVHNYGHGGHGYQASFGCAEAAVKLAKDALQRKRAAML